MAGTIRIKKSKALNFKKLTFLYLVFIVFFFLSTSGDFVHHFIALAKTQASLNQKLKSNFKAHQALLPDEINLKNKATIASQIIDSLLGNFETYAEKNTLKGEKLKEQKFAKNVLSKSEIYGPLNQSLINFIACFPQNYQQELVPLLGIDPMAFELDQNAKNKLFFELPNAAVPSVLEQLQSVILTESLKYLKWELPEGGMLKVNSTSDSSLLLGYKSVYYVGEKIDFDFFSRDSIPPTVSINNMSMTPNYKGRHFQISWTPTLAGEYELEANIGNEFINQKLKVIKPALRFLETEQEIAAYLSEPFTLTLDMQGLQHIKNLQFYSENAKIETKGEQLIITPLYEGRFIIEMRSGNLTLDQRSLFALKPKAPLVSLRDIAGANTKLTQAHCLESESKYWQVINFDMILIAPDGSKQIFKSNSRYLRTELRSLEKQMQAGSTIIFDQIRLLNVNGISTAFGSPIFITKP
jgi:hypothetical protein